MTQQTSSAQILEADAETLLAELAARECPNARMLEEHGQYGRTRACASYCPCTGTGLRIPGLSRACRNLCGRSTHTGDYCSACHGTNRIPLRVTDEAEVVWAVEQVLEQRGWFGFACANDGKPEPYAYDIHGFEVVARAETRILAALRCLALALLETE